MAEKAAREASREERRRRKVEIREIREQRVQKDKEAALQRAAELVQSNRVPIEITRGAAAATAAANAAVNATSVVPVEINLNTPEKRTRSSIIVSSARDLQQIVTHSRNLWAKYNAIAKQHNQKVNWITVAKELGIHVKVREKYARMYSRAEQRGFDFVNCGHYKIKDYPHIFLDPTVSEAPNNRNEGQYVKVDDNAFAVANTAAASTKRQKPSQQIIQRHILETLPNGEVVKVKGTVIPGTIDQYNTLPNSQELLHSSSSNSNTIDSPKTQQQPQDSLESVLSPVMTLQQKQSQIFHILTNPPAQQQHNQANAPTVIPMAQSDMQQIVDSQQSEQHLTAMSADSSQLDQDETTPSDSLIDMQSEQEVVVPGSIDASLAA